MEKRSGDRNVDSGFQVQLGKDGGDSTCKTRLYEDEWSVQPMIHWVWYGMVWCGVVWYGMVWYGILGFNVPLDTVQVISETDDSLSVSRCKSI